MGDLNDFDSWIDAFESAWLDGSRPDLSLYLPSDSPVAEGCSHLDLLRELVKVDLEYRWRSSAESIPTRSLPARPSLEHYLKLFPGRITIDQDLVAEEFRVRSAGAIDPTSDPSSNDSLILKLVSPRRSSRSKPKSSGSRPVDPKC